MNQHDALRAFVAVMEEGSFAAAARQLGLSRAYVSRAMGELESALHVRLFHRTTRALTPTVEAHALRERMAPLLRQWDDALASVRSGEELRGKIRVAAPRNYGEQRVAPVIARFCNAHPGVEVELVLSDRRVELVQDGFDLAIRVATPLDASHMFRRLAPSPVHVIAATEYLEREGTPQTPEELIGHRAVIDTNLDVGVRWPFRVGTERKVITMRAVASVNSPVAAVALVREGVGVGLVSSAAVLDQLRDGGLVCLLPDFPVDLRFDVHLLYPAGRFLAPRVQALIDTLLQARPPARDAASEDEDRKS